MPCLTHLLFKLKMNSDCFYNKAEDSTTWPKLGEIFREIINRQFQAVATSSVLSVSKNSKKNLIGFLIDYSLVP